MRTMSKATNPRRLSTAGPAVVIALAMGCLGLLGSYLWHFGPYPRTMDPLLAYSLFLSFVVSVAPSAAFIALTYWADHRSRTSLVVVATGTLIHIVLTVEQIGALLSGSSTAGLGVMILISFDFLTVVLTGLVTWTVAGANSIR